MCSSVNWFTGMRARRPSGSEQQPDELDPNSLVLDDEELREVLQERERSYDPVTTVSVSLSCVSLRPSLHFTLC